MESLLDFLKCLGTDLLLSIFKRLYPADLVRASIISRDWQDFVTSSELSKQLCLSQFPQLANVMDVQVTSDRKRERKNVGSSENGKLILSRNHKVYASLLHALQKLKSSPIDCIRGKHSVSNYQSKGENDANDIPEKLIFKLKYDQCIITEINMRPYREYLKGVEEEAENYSTKSVRFRMGFRKTLRKRGATKDTADEIIWTYTSPEFPMGQVCKPLAQGRRGQKFELPEPVLCIGGFVMVELLGRVQLDPRKGPYQIKIKNVNVLGRSLAPAFEAEIKDVSGKFDLKYDSTEVLQTIQPPPDEWDDWRSGSYSEPATCACECQLV